MRSRSGAFAAPEIDAGRKKTLFAPAGTPKAIMDKLSAETQRIVGDPAFREYRQSRPCSGCEFTGFAALIARDRATAALVVKDAKL